MSHNMHWTHVRVNWVMGQRWSNYRAADLGFLINKKWKDKITSVTLLNLVKNLTEFESSRTSHEHYRL